MGINYGTAAEANRRLSSTVVVYKNKPIYVREIGLNPDGGTDLVMYYYALPMTGRGSTKTIKMSDPDLNYTNMRLGYMNTPYEAVFCSRAPGRIQQQGICHGNFIGNYKFADPDQQFGPGAFIDFRYIYKGQPFSDMMTGTYPNFAEACERLKTTPNLMSVAFSRELAIEKDPDLDELWSLMHKGERVAFGDPENMRLAKKYNYLRQLALEKGLVLLDD